MKSAFSVTVGKEGLVVAPAVEDAEDRDGLVDNRKGDDDALLVAEDAQTRPHVVAGSSAQGNSARLSQNVMIASVHCAASSGEPLSAM